VRKWSTIDQANILNALSAPRTLDGLVEAMGISPKALAKPVWDHLANELDALRRLGFVSSDTNHQGEAVYRATPAMTVRLCDEDRALFKRLVAAAEGGSRERVQKQD
jgi:hypothetical protein